MIRRLRVLSVSAARRKLPEVEDLFRVVVAGDEEVSPGADVPQGVTELKTGEDVDVEVGCVVELREELEDTAKVV